MNCLQPVVSPGVGAIVAPLQGAKVILVFASTTQTLNAEDLLDGLEMPFELIPVPKAVNPNCGLAISFDEADGPAISQALAGAHLAPESVYHRHGDEYEPQGDARLYGAKAAGEMVM